MFDIETIYNLIGKCHIRTSDNDDIGPDDKTSELLLRRTLEAPLWSFTRNREWCSEKRYQLFQESNDLRNSPYANFDTTIEAIRKKLDYAQQLEVSEKYYDDRVNELQAIYITEFSEVWKPRSRVSGAAKSIMDTSEGMELARMMEQFKDRIDAAATKVEEEPKQ